MTSPIILVEILSIAVLFGSLQAGKTRHCCERVKNLESQLFSCRDNMKMLQGKTAGRQAGKPSRDILCSDAAIKKIEHALHLCRQAEKTIGKKYCSDQIIAELKEAKASCTRRSTKLVEKTAGLQAGKTRHCCERVKNLESQLFSCNYNMALLLDKTAGRQAGKPSGDIHCSGARLYEIEFALHKCLQAEKTSGDKSCSERKLKELHATMASCMRRSTELVEKTSECEGHNEEFDPCASHCGEDFCGSDPSEVRECILSCNPSCVCKKGYIRHEGQCISRAKCDLLIRENSQM